MLNLDFVLALRSLLLARNAHFLLVGIGLIVVAGALLGFSTSNKTTNAVSLSSQETNTVKTESDSISNTDLEHIFVDIGGAVEHPGIYKLKSGSRIADLLHASGGVSTDTASAAWFLKNINTAKTLFDEQKVYIPFEWEVYESTQSIADLSNFPILTDSNGAIQSLVTPEAVAETSTKTNNETSDKKETTSSQSALQVAEKDATQGSVTATSGKINVNTASSVDLESLEGIGTVYASRIIQNRPYTSLEELKDKAKLTDSVIAKIRNAITF